MKKKVSGKGGWGAPFSFDARLLKFLLTGQGRSVRREPLYKGEGTHEAVIADVDGDGRPDIVVAEENVDWNTRRSYFARVAWLENTDDPRRRGFVPHVVDRIFCPHSLSVADLDGDGKPEIVAAEHNPFNPYHSRCGLFVDKLADPKGSAWFRFMLDAKFGQHWGAKVVELAPGKHGILGHAWMESRYVHLWRND
jgi:hypothetical protein